MPLMLATYLPLPVLTLLGDVPPPPVPAGAPWWAQYLVLAAPAFGLWLFSNLVGALNEHIRKADAGAVPVSPRLRLVASVLNVMAGNLDKSREQKAIASGTAAPRAADPSIQQAQAVLAAATDAAVRDSQAAAATEVKS